MKRLVIRLSISILTVITLSVFADDVISTQGTGQINWSKGVILAQGYGVAPATAPDRQKRLLARRAAQVDAYRNLGEILNGVRVTSETLVHEFAANNDSVKTKLDTLVKGAQIVKDNYQNEIATVTLALKMDGGFMGTITPEIEYNNIVNRGFADYSNKHLLSKLLSIFPGTFNIFPSAHASENTPLSLITNPNQLELAEKILQQLKEKTKDEVVVALSNDVAKYQSNNGFTGLIIDAKSVSQFELATIPRIRNEDGLVIYPSISGLRSTLSTKRPVSYDFDVDDAIKNERVAFEPLVVQAQGVYRARLSDLVVSNEVAERILTSTSIQEKIKTAGVMIVVSQ